MNCSRSSKVGFIKLAVSFSRLGFAVREEVSEPATLVDALFAIPVLFVSLAILFIHLVVEVSLANLRQLSDLRTLAELFASFHDSLLVRHDC